MDAALVVPGLAVLGGLVAAAGWRLETRRRDELFALARRQGWSLTRRDDVWTTAFEGEPFGRGTDRTAQNVLTGRYRDRDLVAFDYSCRSTTVDGHGVQHVQVHRFGVAALALPVPVPLVEVVPSRLPRVFGRGLETESAQFNARYRVRAEEPRLAYDVLAPRTLQLLLDRPPTTWRLHGGTALTWDRGRNDPAGLLQRLDTVSDVLDAVPGWVWEDRR